MPIPFMINPCFLKKFASTRTSTLKHTKGGSYPPFSATTRRSLQELEPTVYSLHTQSAVSAYFLLQGRYTAKPTQLYRLSLHEFNSFSSPRWWKSQSLNRLTRFEGRVNIILVLELRCFAFSVHDLRHR